MNICMAHEFGASHNTRKKNEEIVRMQLLFNTLSTKRKKEKKKKISGSVWKQKKKMEGESVHVPTFSFSLNSDRSLLIA